MCGATITDISQLKQRLVNTIANIQSCAVAPTGEARELEAQTAKLGTALTAYQRDYSFRLSRYQDVEARIKRVPQVTADLDALNRNIQDLRQSRQALLSTIQRNSKLTERKDGLERACTVINQGIADVGRTLGQAVGTPDQVQRQIQDVQTDIAALNRAQSSEQLRLMQVAQDKGQISELEKAITALEDTVVTLERKQAQQGTQTAVLGTLDKVRSWFNYANGPRNMATAVLAEMNTDVNKFLSNFTSPFSVTPDESTFGFRCLFTDGRQTPSGGPPDASMLSGGQKVQLAVAFRLASYCMFAGKLGLLSLDEPSAYLDDANIGRFGDLLVQIKKIASGMNLQLIMATHEQSLTPFADTVINLGGTNAK